MTVKDSIAHKDPERHEEGPGYQPRQLVLLGAGYAHLHLLQHLARQPFIGVQIILIAPHARQLHTGMLPDFVAGHCTLDDSAIPLEPLVRRSGVQWLQRSVKALHATQQTLQLDDGSTLHYDWLSVNTGAIQNRARLERNLPGVRKNGLFVRPVEAFGSLWPQVTDMAQARNLRIAVVGAGASGSELAMAVKHRLPACAVTLVTGSTLPGSAYPLSMQQGLLALLKKRGITVLQDTATAVQAESVQLACGADLVSDIALITTGAQPPLWLAKSTLALDADGFLAVDAHQRSTSHPQVFATGDVSTRMDCTLPRNGVYAVRAGPVLAHNLRAAMQEGALQSHSPPAGSLNIVSCGDRYAIATWRGFTAQGRWLWWLKRWIDRRFVGQYRRGG
jgi:NADH dehydrogenase FAD-containing subunit